jgi:hypothetical protein
MPEHHGTATTSEGQLISFHKPNSVSAIKIAITKSLLNALRLRARRAVRSAFEMMSRAVAAALRSATRSRCSRFGLMAGKVI